MWHDVRTLNATTNALLGLLVLGLLASGFWWVAHRPMFTFRVVVVEGAQGAPLRHVSAPTIRTTALPGVKGNFFTADLDAVRQAFESVPWVRQATVRREWPNRLIVNVEEHRALGAWGDDGRLLSVKGEVFTANLAEAEADGPLPVFSGPEGSAKDVVARFRELHEWLKPAGLVPESVALSERYAWTVKLVGGMTVELGREQARVSVQERAQRLVGIYPQLAARLQDRIETVDMRYPNGLALSAQGLKLATEGKKK
ncbi:MAG TPA: cell division protein FtsQ/DivIB [Noviherbaspirillum sp.]|nr:cell division protein FtsQ/DivIB [Noviherbaspirillum sp.]